MAFAKKETSLVVTPPNFEIVELVLIGTSALVQCKFSVKAQNQMMEKMKQGSAAKSTKDRSARDFENEHLNAAHIAVDGWYGIPAPSFRNALISACRTVGVMMTRARLAAFIEADGTADDGYPLAKLLNPDNLDELIGEPEAFTAPVRNATGVIDLRCRPRWDKWACKIRVKYDADMLTAESVVNLIGRAGIQVGVGDGRPDSKQSNGMGWGTWRIAGTDELNKEN